MAQAYALQLDIRSQRETFERTETWRFRFAGIMGILNISIDLELLLTKGRKLDTHLVQTPISLLNFSYNR